MLRDLYQILIMVGLSLSTVFVDAQHGPEVPCPDCQQNHVKPTPYEGSWFNPEQSGLGFIFEVENDKLLGYYFGYDDQGLPMWALFNGQLQDASDQGALWKVNGTLSNYIGGNCINCDYKPPSQIKELGEIEVVFNRHGHASFSINGGEVQNIIPLYFGFQTLDYFAEQTSFPIPELEGWWTVYIDEYAFLPNIPDVYTYSSFDIYIYNGEVATEGIYKDRLVFNTASYPRGGNEVNDGGHIICENQTVNPNTSPSCYYESPSIYGRGVLRFNVDIANITSDRIYGETETGDTIEMIRLSQDTCLQTNKPENCINTDIFDYLDN